MSSSLAQQVNTLQAPQDTLLPLGTTSTPYRSIVVSNVKMGEGDVIATMDVKIGSVIVRNVSLRRGRGNSTHVNYPAFKNEDGRWVHLVEIVSPALESAVNAEIFKAASGATR